MKEQLKSTPYRTDKPALAIHVSSLDNLFLARQFPPRRRGMNSPG
jgi:hypothetical protein